VSSCRSCGAQLGVGRFCTNCGAPVDSSAPDGTPVSTPVTGGDWRTDTAERRPRATTPAGPAVSAGNADPRTPPSAVAPPPPPRYPLYADEVEGWTPYGPLVASRAERRPQPTAATPVAAPPPAETAGAGWDQGHGEHYEEYEGYEGYYDEERRSPWLWILVTAVVLGLLAAGWWFFVRDDGSTARDTARPGAEQTADAGTDVAARATVEAPETAPPNQDVNGDQVAYDASNMLDGVPETAWRVAGDASGMELTFTLREPTVLHRVGLLNGYAKTSTDDKGRTYDWYLGNRRVKAVVWVFDDGTKLRQQLREDREVQMTDIDSVETSKVVLRLVRVTRPGTGTASRDFTAISEVSLVGEPQS